MHEVGDEGMKHPGDITAIIINGKQLAIAGATPEARFFQFCALIEEHQERWLAYLSGVAPEVIAAYQAERIALADEAISQIDSHQRGGKLRGKQQRPVADANLEKVRAALGSARGVKPINLVSYIAKRTGLSRPTVEAKLRRLKHPIRRRKKKVS